jgi:2-dehydro-3-deoxygalactonokinase
MIGVDWGTSRFRAFRMASDGTIRDRRAGPRGILQVADGRFADALREEIGPWLAAGEERVLLSGMIGSRQGWVEAPYLPCPAGVDNLAGALIDVPFTWAQVKLVPGLSGTDETGVAEVMRGEETQLAGVMASVGQDGLVCLPGTHSKWARIEGGRVVRFATHLTGEAFAALRGHTILGRMMRDGASGGDGFARGLARSAEPGGLLHHLFGVRALGLAGRLADEDAGSYLSGLLIGHEVRAALSPEVDVHLVGAPELARLYAEAIASCGGRSVTHDADAAARGLYLIAETARWS